MTLFLASVVDEAEATMAVAGGVDFVDFKDPTKGALGALDARAVRRGVKAVAGRRRASAVAGDPDMQPSSLAEAVETIAATGVDYVKIALPADAWRAARIAALAPLALATKLVGVIFADEEVDPSFVDELAAAGFAGAMLDTAVKGSGRLLDHRDPAWLACFLARAQGKGLIAGLAGSLEPPDVPRLLPLGPDVLGFRGALCAMGQREAGLDAKAIELVRGLIPPDAGSGAGERAEQGIVDYQRLVGRGYAVESSDRASRADRVFVRDFVLPIRIGAYRSERDGEQRVRFDVDAFVQRGTHLPADMRDVLSYDIITDGIRRIVAEGHVELTETLAERVAGLVLGQPRVAKVVVRVAKLDIGPGGVGVEITREKTAEATILRHPGERGSSR
jgi:(5-formylfuran-3-yl)methyl phosphate synthase